MLTFGFRDVCAIKCISDTPRLCVGRLGRRPREAVINLSKEAASLAKAGFDDDATDILITVSRLRVKALNERANAAAIRIAC